MESYGDVNSLIDGVTTGSILNPRGICSACPTGGNQTHQMDDAKFRSLSNDSGNESSKSSSSRETIGM